jgi:succinoglycan biosynthesis protein ExoL
VDVLFVMPAEGQPRYTRRLTRLLAQGLRVSSIGFERDRFPPGISTIHPDVCLGTLRDKRYMSRIATLVRSLPLIRAAVRQARVVHAFGMDMAFLTFLASIGIRRPVITEIGDIHPLQTRESGISPLIRSIEKHVVTRSESLVVTSTQYATEYLEKVRGIRGAARKTITIHNVPPSHTEAAAPPASPQDWLGTSGPQEGSIVIGYFGLIRCSKSVELLLEWLDYEPVGRLLVAGTLHIGRLAKPVLSHPRVEFRGPYRNPTDLPELYSNVDLVWAPYQLGWSRPGNWEWARTNRFFEACYFGTPPIVRHGTPDGEVVQSTNIGMVLEVPAHDWRDCAVRQLRGLRRSQVETWRRRLTCHRAQLLRSGHEEGIYASHVARIVARSDIYGK